jgi:uncharacterized membrane protein
MELFEITRERFEVVHQDISEGSEPALRFYILVAVSTLIAGFGLISSSTAVVIGAMLVAPLMTPIFGISLALGEVAAGLGSFLLFFANCLSILVVASLTFVLSGMAKRFGVREKGFEIFKRFRLPLITFVLIAAFLGHSLIKIAWERRIAKSIRATLIEETSRIPATILTKEHFYLAEDDNRIHVVAGVNTPAVLPPSQVSRIPNRLADAVGKPIELIMHCVLSSNVSAQGSVRNTFTQNYDGTFTKSSDNEVLKNIAMTEQIMREHIAEDGSLNLSRVEYVPFGDQKVMLAHIVGVREMTQAEIQVLEAKIRTATGDRAILDDKFQCLLEITGPEVYPHQNIELLESRLSQKFSEPIVLYAWSRIDIVHGPDGPLSIKKLSRYFSDRQKESLPDEAAPLPGASNR